MTIFDFLAFTIEQTDKLIVMLEHILTDVSRAVVAVWTLLSPALLAAVLYKQARSDKKLDENTKLTIATRAETKNAFDVANGHNEKIERLTQQISDHQK